MKGIAGWVLLTVLLSVNALAEPFVIVEGQATVDGVISTGEWDEANWLAMDQVYHGTPIDLTNAWWAAQYDPLANALYVAVRGNDSDHVLHAHTAWNGQDCIELYINARNDDTTGFQEMADRKFDYAQQYVAGFDALSTSVWVVLGGGTPIPSNAMPHVAIGVATNELTYEYRLRPYDVFDYDNPANSTEVQLRSRLVIGLDVVMNSRTSGGTFGMLCENTDGGKFSDAGAMRDHKLQGPPGTLIIPLGTHPLPY